MKNEIQIDKELKCEFERLFKQRFEQCPKQCLEEKSLVGRVCITNVDNDEEWFYMQVGKTRYKDCFHLEVINGGIEFHIEECDFKLQKFSDDDCKNAQKYFSKRDEFSMFEFENERNKTIGGYCARYKEEITPKKLFTIFFELSEKLDPIINEYVNNILK